MPTIFSDDPVFALAAVVSVTLFLVCLDTYLRILPSIFKCFGNWKANLELEDSLQLSRSRNLIAGISLIPLAMVIYSYDLCHPDFLDKVPEPWKFPTVLGILAGYLTLRAFLNWQLETTNYRNKVFIAANNSFYNFIIVLFLVLFLVAVVVEPFVGVSEALSGVVVAISAILYCFYIIRRGEIFASVRGPLPTILYLCGLEILPTGILVMVSLTL